MRHAIFAKNLGLQIIYFALCTFNSNASFNFHKKSHMDDWARCACKKIFHSPHLCLTLTPHTIFTQKRQIKGAVGLAMLT